MDLAMSIYLRVYSIWITVVMFLDPDIEMDL